MFENILYQENVCDELSREIEKQTLPSSLLFSGPEYGGKLSTALELARALSCETLGAPWNCSCSSCNRHRLLINTNLLMLGDRYFLREIRACADSLLRVDKLGTRYLFIRSVRKLTRRFDAVLWEGEDTKLGKTYDKISRVEELLDTLEPEANDGKGNFARKETDLHEKLQEIVKLSEEIVKKLPKGNIPIVQIRKMGTWAHLRSAGSAKVIILENADRMLESSRNALLKLLEETPPSVYIILITTRKAAIIPTIKSRLRSYTFTERERSESEQICKRIFQWEEEAPQDLREFFLRFTTVTSQPEELKNKAFTFLRAVSDPSEDPSSLIEVISRELSGESEEAIRYFVEELLRASSRMLREAAKDQQVLTRLERWMGLYREALERVETLNMNPSLVIESLYHKMKDST